MPLLREHIADSKKRTGKEFKELHEWLDGEGLSYVTRVRRHNPFNKKNREHVLREFGKGALAEYEHHQAADIKVKPIITIAKRWQKER